MSLKKNDRKLVTLNLIDIPTCFTVYIFEVFQRFFYIYYSLVLIGPKMRP